MTWSWQFSERRKGRVRHHVVLWPGECSSDVLGDMHMVLVDCVRKVDLPSLFITIAPLEALAPFHQCCRVGINVCRLPLKKEKKKKKKKNKMK